MTVFTIANIGAEEPLEERLPEAAIRVARLFLLLFPRDAKPLGETRDLASAWPEALGAPPDQPAFSWIADGHAFAWLNTPEAAALAAAANAPLAGAEPDVVRRVHDKGFAHAACEEAGLVPRPLRGLIERYEPEDLADPTRAARTIRERVGDWPDWTDRRFTLKPRLGGSGRGRIGGDVGADFEEIARGLPRLARQGGALLEPWLEREADLSAQLYVAPDGAVTLLGTLALECSASGVYRGHRALLDHRLRVHSGSDHDDALLEAAMALADAAHREGFHGPCGIDAFVFRGPDGPLLRPAVELNARFTMGTLVRGLFRRLRPLLRERLAPTPGELRELRFALAPPDGGWPESTANRLVLPLDDSRGGPGPAIVVGSTAADQKDGFITS